MQWFRFYHDALDDEKVQFLCDKSFRLWVNLLCLASQSEPRGVLPNVETIAFRLRLSLRATRKMLDEFVSVGLLDVDAETGYSPHNWDGRQRVSDSSTERVAKHRAEQKRRVTNEENVTLHETPQKRSSRARTDTDTELDTTSTHVDVNSANCATSVASVVDTPYLVFAAFLKESGYDDSKTAKPWRSKQLGIAKRLVEQGFGVDKVSRCVRYMKSQTWRTSPFDLIAVEQFIGTWEAAGMPEIDKPKANGRASPVGNVSKSWEAIKQVSELVAGSGEQHELRRVQAPDQRVSRVLPTATD
jgi:hypothetical protein